jgi:hypothetical protein
MRPEDTYGLRAVPRWVYLRDISGEHQQHGRAAWSGDGEPPAIGTRIHIRINGFNWAVVQGYFIESGYLGTYARPTRPPRWWTRQMREVNNIHERPFPNAAMVFGAELSWVKRKDGTVVSARPRKARPEEKQS